MKLTIFGATGHTGKYILEEALKTGHDVTVLLRDLTKLPPSVITKLNVISGDAFIYDDVVKAVTGQDVIISALSEGPSIVHKTQSSTAANIIKAMQEYAAPRFICMGAVGILQFNANELIRDQPFYPELYRPLSFEHSAVNKLLQGSGLRWTQVCPPTILASSADGKYAVKAEYPPNKNMEVNAGNIGLFMMRELEENTYTGKRVGIVNI